MDDTGIPKEKDKIVENAIALVEKLEPLGLNRSGIYLDFLVQPLSVDTENGNLAFDCIETIMAKLAGVHTTCGLSNISYGLPERFLINRTFISIAISKGLDSAIIDPLDKKIMTAILTAEALVGKDEYCSEFIDAKREGKLES
jgi:5-methyltetrahydrofolate--homocysteine methyltransferase